jgi:hypothetical protein
MRTSCTSSLKCSKRIGRRDLVLLIMTMVQSIMYLSGSMASRGICTVVFLEATVKGHIKRNWCKTSYFGKAYCLILNVPKPRQNVANPVPLSVGKTLMSQ